jgi:hypothetical protein
MDDSQFDITKLRKKRKKKEEEKKTPGKNHCRIWPTSDRLFEPSILLLLLLLLYWGRNDDG